MKYAKAISKLSRKKLYVYFPVVPGIDWNEALFEWVAGLGKKRVNWNPTEVDDEGGMWVQMSKDYIHAVAHGLFAANGVPCDVSIEQTVTEAICTDSCENAYRDICVCSCGGDNHKIGLEGENVLRFDGVQIAIGIRESRKMVFPLDVKLNAFEQKRLSLIQEKRRKANSVAA